MSKLNLVVNGITFVPSTKKVIESLFVPLPTGKTAGGLYKVTQKTIRFYKLDGELFAIALKGGGFHSAYTLENGKTFFMHGLCSSDAASLGISECGWIDQHNISSGLFEIIELAKKAA